MKITISLNGNQYIWNEDGRPLEFKTVREAVVFLANRNWTIEDLREVDFNVEEAE